jgi:hypothetical protein
VHTVLDRRVEYARAVQMQGQASSACKLMRALQVIERQRLAALRVLQAQQARAREMGIVRLDRARDAIQVECTVRFVVERLRLNAAEHGSAAALVLVRMSLLADDVFFAALAMRHQPEQIALRAARDEQRCLLAEHLRREPFEAIDRRIFAVDVIAHLRRRHRGAHGRARQSDGVAAQVDRFHGRLRMTMQGMLPQWVAEREA